MDMLQTAMRHAISEARTSLREGNHGFGAVILRDGQIIAQAHDREETDQDPTSHAETNAIRLAAATHGKHLDGCILVATHEPCPMCSAATLWSGITEVAYGYSIARAIAQGHTRIDLPVGELFARGGKTLTLHPDVLAEECAVLYHPLVRSEIKRLRNVSEADLAAYNQDSIERRLAWFAENRHKLDFLNGDPLESAYELILRRLGLTPSEAPIVEKDHHRLVFHSLNFCPTLEACQILGLDTRSICKRYNENSMNALIRQIDPRLRFARNYEKLRPYAAYCEEMILLE
ncbi:cytosine/adenosine deaminases [Longilinea arvoryzae]|uniref:Cytosine/adenosine deaminases n=1 Tax=Longilinea arvoryzae TaxID=360412 RepID=A0A0S7BFY3_9CHLR|nr:nucleoside deaminase [Longilinea arvoryzae]GAP12378.1 cytosine/adenosine deaminases [Longilinea arvoryzae]